MRVIHLELVNSHGMTLDSSVLNIEEGDQDEDRKINAAVVAFVQQMILNTGDSIRISEYQ